MALDKNDLELIKGVVVEAITESFEELSAPRFEALEGRMDNLEGRMDGLDGRMDNLEGKIGNLEGGQRETNRRLAKVEADLEIVKGNTKAITADVKELYRMFNELKRELAEVAKANKFYRDKLDKIEKFVYEVSAHTGIPYAA